jgi:xylulokinase
MFLGIDIGTSAVKFVLVDARQTLVAAIERPLAPVQPKPLWSEDDPETWWRAVVSGLDALARQYPKYMSGVVGLGLSGQMHSAVLLDEKDAPVRPAILWNDGRSTKEASELAALGLDLQCETGVLPMPGFTGPKFLWLSRNEPRDGAPHARIAPGQGFHPPETLGREGDRSHRCGGGLAPR